MKNMMLLLFTSLIIIVSNSSFNLLHSDFELSNPVSTTLTNGNIFIINKYGVYICDKSLSTIIKTSLSFSADNQLTKDDLTKVIISRLENKAVICLIKDSVYIFDNQGNYLSVNNVRLGLIGGTPGAYTLFGLGLGDYSYNYYVGFTLNNQLYLQYFEYIVEYNRTDIISANYEGIQSCQYKNVKDDILSCQIMINSNNKKKIICFYIIINNDSTESFGIGQIDVDGGSFRRSSAICKNHEIDKVATMKSFIDPESKKAFICVIFISGENNCFNYDITNSYDSGFNFNNFNCNDKLCQTNFYSLNVDYISSKDKYIFGCSGEDNNITTCVFNV